jgi:thiol-disulfide isomerase/thioredoxin
VLVALALAGGMLLAQAGSAGSGTPGPQLTTAPATGPGATTTSVPATGPAAKLAELKEMMRSPRPRTPEELEATIKQRVPEILKVVDAMQKEYPKADETAEAELVGVVTASQLARITEDKAVAEKAKQYALAVLESNAKPELKVFADAHLLLMKIQPMGTSQPAADTAKMVNAFIDKYAKTPVCADAIMSGLNIAQLFEDEKLFEQLKDRLIKECPEHPVSRDILRKAGKSVDLGKPFKATLTLLDGKKLTLPDDLKGKVVVVDFWATWCMPCVMAMPDMKAAYKKYKDQGVQFVGISLDEKDDKAKVAEFVKQQEIAWPIAFSGQGWEDPTARQYGIASIPSVWVVGKDGLVVSDDAREKLGETIEAAIKGVPASGPATRPATMPRK